MDDRLVKELTALIQDKSEDFRIHEKMFDILDGNLSPHLDEWIDMQLSGQSAYWAKARKSPVNIMKKVVDKLSTIYQQNPSRVVMDGSETDQALIGEYEYSMSINQIMNIANEQFNMAKSCLIQPYIHLGKPKLRAIPNNKFVVFSNDEVDPTYPTHILVCIKKEKSAAGTKTYWSVWSKEEFFIIDSDGDIRFDMMRDMGFEDTSNPIGEIPYIYVNRSFHQLLPKPDIDMLGMSLLIPGILTDLNYASMFSMFSIVYAVDVDPSGQKRAPSAVWVLNTDPDTDKKPEIGTIKPEASVTDTLELVRSQLAFWLQTRNIRPGSVGEIDGSSFASAVSKMVDEADTTDERKRQVEFFKDAEKRLWDLIMTKLHPYWIANGSIASAPLFSPRAWVNTSFTEQIPLFNRGEIIKNLKEEVEAGFLTKRRAIKKANPEFSEEDVDELTKEIEEENALKLPMPIEQVGEIVDGASAA